MSTRQGKRYTTSYKEREHPKQDPYAHIYQEVEEILLAPVLGEAAG